MRIAGPVTLTLATYERVLTELLASVRRHGFRRILVVNGHGGNSTGRSAAETWAAGEDGADLRWHDWWSAPQVRAAIDAVDPDASHASWMETFPWTLVSGVEVPAGHKEPVDLSKREELSPARFREVVGDGSFGGDYGRDDDEMLALWDVAVREVRERLTEGWS